MTKEEKLAWDHWRLSQGEPEQDATGFEKVLRRDPNNAGENPGIFQSVPDEPTITSIRRIIVYPKDEHQD